jgi:hypothetical protein
MRSRARRDQITVFHKILIHELGAIGQGVAMKVVVTS